jgi:hypothetical protein
MELFSLHIEGGRELCNRLAKIQPIKRVHVNNVQDSHQHVLHDGANDETYVVRSKILANAEVDTALPNRQ